MGQKVSLCSSNQRPLTFTTPVESGYNSSEDIAMTPKKTLNGKMKQTAKDSSKLMPQTQSLHSRMQKIQSKMAKKYKEDADLTTGAASPIIRSEDSHNCSQVFLDRVKFKSLDEAQERGCSQSLKDTKVIKIRITWNYGGNEVFIIGSFTNWEYMIKMHKKTIGHIPIFEISMYVKEGLYHYHFVVDGKVRFSPDQPSTIDKSQKIVNYIDIDKYMIQQVEEARESSKDIMNMEDFLAYENSWKLSENFEKNCKERCQVSMDDDMNFSFELKSLIDDCQACHRLSKTGKKKSSQNMFSGERVDQFDQTEKDKSHNHLNCVPSASYIEMDFAIQNEEQLSVSSFPQQ